MTHLNNIPLADITNRLGRMVDAGCVVCESESEVRKAMLATLVDEKQRDLLCVCLEDLQWVSERAGKGVAIVFYETASNPAAVAAGTVGEGGTSRTSEKDEPR